MVMHLGHGNDSPDVDRSYGFPPIVRRCDTPSGARHCEVSYAIPRYGPYGILSAVWQMTDTDDWHVCRYLVGTGEMPDVKDMGEVPVWMMIHLAAFVEQIAVGLREER